MDPMLIFGTLQTATQLAVTCYDIGEIVSRIRTSYKGSCSTIRSIETECKVFQTTVEHIRLWLQDQATNASIKIQIQSVGSALGLIDESMKDLRATLTKITEKGNGPSSGPRSDRWMKAKYVMNENTLKTHLQELREHARLVQFTLATLQLYMKPPKSKSPTAHTRTVVRQKLQRRPQPFSAKLPRKHWPSDELVQ